MSASTTCDGIGASFLNFCLTIQHNAQVHQHFTCEPDKKPKEKASMFSNEQKLSEFAQIQIKGENNGPTTKRNTNCTSSKHTERDVWNPLILFAQPNLSPTGGMRVLVHTHWRGARFPPKTHVFDSAKEKRIDSTRSENRRKVMFPTQAAGYFLGQRIVAMSTEKHTSPERLCLNSKPDEGFVNLAVCVLFLMCQQRLRHRGEVK